MRGEVAYEHREFIHDGSYPTMGDQHIPSPDPDAFADHNDVVVGELANGVAYGGGVPNFTDADPNQHLDLTSPTQHATVDATAVPDTAQLQRVPAVAKPERPVTKNAAGKFVCEWVGCNDAVKEWTRKCEWTKHMDKHDRPYKCHAPGCEKLPGFTYSGGLLRHEREVHGKHGGPKNTFLCPHATCKRHVNKGFSRQENLNEHLRRVHTENGSSEADADAEAEVEADGDNDCADAGPSPPIPAPRKRKRHMDDDDDDEKETLRRLTKKQKKRIDELERELENRVQECSTLIAKTQAMAMAMDMHMGGGLANAPPMP
jgi:hypothetical protein